MIFNVMIFKEILEKNNFSVYPIKKANVYSNALCRLFPFLKVLFVDTSFFKNEDDWIIYFDAGIRDSYYLNYLKNSLKNKRLIYYYWNPVETTLDPTEIPDCFEKWSYSLTDCQKYGLKFNPTFYFDDLVEESSLGITQDVFFIGKDKGRYAELKNFEKLFAEKGLSTKFFVTANHSISLCRKYSKSISYKEVLENVKRSKCLFDFYSDSLAGLSLRAMESLFFGKKLITNNKTIREYDFFHPENIFILGERDLIELKNFVCSEYLPISKDVKKKYLFSEWLKRFK
ncbi:MAG: hypothetical protein MJY47_01030 [Fibrobacter sp.]|nr:hypothetical protein [Fibrobacter sp.]